MTSVAAIAYVADLIGAAPSVSPAGSLVLSRADFRTVLAAGYPPVQLDITVRDTPATISLRARAATTSHQAASTSPGRVRDSAPAGIEGP